MARPQALQLLKHGKALCGSVFRLFVETWNYIVQRADGIVGDRDVNADEGCIYVDNSTPERPVIRLDRSKIRSGRSSGSGASAYPSVYEVETTDTTPERKHFIHRYYEVSGVLHEGPDVSGSLESYADKFVAIRIKANGSTEIATYSSFSQMQGDMVDQSKVVMPLYKLDENGDPAIDLRHIPRADMWSLALPSAS